MKPFIKNGKMKTTAFEVEPMKKTFDCQIQIFGAIRIECT